MQVKISVNLTDGTYVYYFKAYTYDNEVEYIRASISCIKDQYNYALDNPAVSEKYKEFREEFEYYLREHNYTIIN